MALGRLLTPEDVFRWRSAAEISAGPGLRVVFTLREADMEKSAYRTHIWSVEPGEEPRQLTRGSGGCSAPQWSPDGAHLAFLSSRPAESGMPEGNGEPKSQVWLLPSAGGEAFCLTRAPRGVRSFAWAPDGRSLFFVAEEPELDAERARKQKEKKQKRDAIVVHGEKRRRQLWQVEAREGAEARLCFDGCFGLSEIAVSPDGQEVAYTTNYTGLWEDFKRLDLWVLNVQSGQTRQLTSGTGGLSGPRWSPDGSRIAFSAPHDPRYSYSRIELFAVPAAGGAVESLCAAVPDFTGDVVEHAWVSPEELLILAAEGCYVRLARLDLKAGRVTRLSGEDEVVVGLALTPDRRHAAYLAESARSLPDVKLLDLGAGSQPEPQALTDLNPFLREEFRWGEQRVIAWQAEDGRSIEGVLTLPPDYREGQRCPLLVYVHGGPHGHVTNRLRQYLCFQVLAAEGYAVLAPNYRGSLGYGHEFAIANRCDLGGGDFRDIMAGVDHLIAQGIADGERMGILGGSYGGYMTNWAIGQTDRFKAAVSMFGIFSLVTDYSMSDLPTWDVEYLDGYWWEKPDLYARCAPSTYVTNIRTPVLIIHGDADNNTSPANSREMYQALRHLGRTVQFVRYPREGHGIAEPNHKRDEYRRVLDWLGRHILGQEPASGGTVTSREGHGLTVTGVHRVAGFSGRRPAGRYVSLGLRLTPATGAQGPLKLDLSEVRLCCDDGGRRWEVGVAGVAAGLVLVPSGGVLEVAQPAAVTLVFDFPEKAPEGEWQLETDPFPPIRVALA